MGILNGIKFAKYIQKNNPFILDDNGKATGVKPTEERAHSSFNSNNANSPLFEQEAKGIILAHSDINNPTVGTLALTWNNARKFAGENTVDSLVNGMKKAFDLSQMWIEDYKTNGLAVVVDHFTCPPFGDYAPDLFPHISRHEAKKRILNALDCLIDADLNYIEKHKNVGDREWNVIDYNFTKTHLEKVRRDKKLLEGCVNYYLSSKFQNYRRACMGVAELPGFIQAASFLPETGELPPWLSLAVVKDIFQGLKERLPTTLMEVSIVDTGEKKIYHYLSDEETDEFSRVAVGVVGYTGADRASYPGGSTHALDISKAKMRPDMPKITKTQMALYNAFRRIIDFIYHGGTSLYPWTEAPHIKEIRNAIKDAFKPEWIRQHYGKDYEAIERILNNALIEPPIDPSEWRGIVGQVNLNTTYLGTAALMDAGFVVNNFDQVIKMTKKAGGYANFVIDGVRKEVVHTAQITGSYSQSPYGGGIDIGKLEDKHIVQGPLSKGAAD